MTTCGLPGALSTIVRVPLTAPGVVAASGAKPTVTLQEEPLLSGVPHWLAVRMKFELAVMEVSLTLEFPVLLKDTFCA